MRKSVFLFAVLLITSVRAFADCPGSLIWVMSPRGEFISPNSAFVIELIGSSTELITQTGPTGVVYLTTQPGSTGITIPNTPNETVKLEAVKVFKGDSYTSQVMLEPTEHLKSGLTYYMVTDSTVSVSLLERFTVTGSDDHTKPEWVCAPAFGGSVYKRLGCGPEIYVNFCCMTTEPSECLVIADVKEEGSGEGHKAFLYPDSTGKTLLGRTMCGGMFELSDTVHYVATFNLMDACGNINDTIHAMYKFPGPALAEDTERDCSCNDEQILKDDVVGEDSNFTKLQFIAISAGAVLALIAVLAVMFVNRKRKTGN